MKNEQQFEEKLRIKTARAGRSKQQLWEWWMSPPLSPRSAMMVTMPPIEEPVPPRTPLVKDPINAEDEKRFRKEAEFSPRSKHISLEEAAHE